MNVKCQACGASFIAPDEKIRGRVLTYKCRRCGAAMRVDGSHLSSGTTGEVQEEERQSYLPMAPDSGPMGRSIVEDVESGWSEPSEVAEKVNVPQIGAFKAPAVPKDLTPNPPATEPSWEPSVGEGERPTIAGSADALVAAMMEDPPARDSAAPTARKPDLEAALKGSELEAEELAKPTPAAGAPAAKPAAATTGAAAAKPVIAAQPAPLVPSANKGALPAALAAGPKFAGGTVPGGLGKGLVPPGGLGTPSGLRSPAGPAPSAATSSDDTPTPIAAKAAVDLTPTPLITRPGAPKAEPAGARAPAPKKMPVATTAGGAAPAKAEAAAITPPAPKAAMGPLLAASSSDDDDPPFLLAPSPKKKVETPATTEDSGLFDLRSLIGGDAPAPAAAKPAPAKPPPARLPPPKPNAPAGGPAKPPPPKPNRPAPRAEAVDASVELDVELGAEDETEPVPVPVAAKAPPAAPVAPAAAKPTAAVDADDEPPPSSDVAPVSLSEIEDAPTSVAQANAAAAAGAANAAAAASSDEEVTAVAGEAAAPAPEAEPAVQGDGPPVEVSDQGETSSDAPVEPAAAAAPSAPAAAVVATPEPAPVAIRDMPTVAAERFKNAPKPTNGARPATAAADDDPFAMGGSLAAPAAALAAPDVTSTTAKTIPPAPRVSRAPTPEELGKGGSKAPIIAGVALLLLGGGIFFATRGGDAPKPPEAPVAARTGDSTKTDTTATAPTADKTVAAVTAEPSKTDTAKTAEPPSKGGDTAKPSSADARPSTADAKPSSGDAKPSSADAKPSVADAKPSGGDAKPSGGDAKPSGGDPKPSAADTKPPEVTLTPIKAAPAAGTAPIDKGAVASAMGGAASAAGACKPADGTGGVARVSVTFSTSGRATQALVNGPPFAGTPTGGCIASKFRSVSIPPFAGEPVTVHKTVSF